MEIDRVLLEKYDVPVPRYTSYPPANKFLDGFSEKSFLKLVEDSNLYGPAHVGFYIHIPFCHKICFYCGCNALTVKGSNIVDDYFNAIEKEILMVTKHLDKNRKVSQIHFGGGTPNSVDVGYISRIIDAVSKHFSFIDNPEIAIECHPAHLNYAYINSLIKCGINRISIGIQDFNNKVLEGVNRLPSALPVNQLIDFIRTYSPAVSVNFDFIYGLPGQTIESFSESIRKAIELRPDRLVTFSYAHVPWLKKHQKILERKELPQPAQKLELFLASRQLLEDSGYISLGLDHYVLPDDELNFAIKNNQLQRNFQGYCTRRTTGQVYAFGVSAISQLNKGYIQNFKDLNLYISKISENSLAVDKGYILSNEDQIIGEAISQLMCNLNIDLRVVSDKFGITLNELKNITGFHESKLKGFIYDGLIDFHDNRLSVNRKGSIFIRNIATVFDPAYKNSTNNYSKSV